MSKNEKQIALLSRDDVKVNNYYIIVRNDNITIYVKSGPRKSMVDGSILIALDSPIISGTDEGFDFKYTSPPSFLEKLRGITWTDKINKNIKKANKWCLKENKKMSKLWSFFKKHKRATILAGE